MLGVRDMREEKASRFPPWQKWQSGVVRATSPQATRKQSVLRRGRFTVLWEYSRGIQPEFGAMVRASSLRSDFYAKS